MLILLFSMSQLGYAQQPGIEKSAASSDGAFEYEGCGCTGKIKLTIFDGISENGEEGMWGGAEVKGTRDKWSDGALAVANLNDTDGDGDVDIVDMNGVKVNSLDTIADKGTNEVDLMKLIIKPKGKVAPSCAVLLEPEGDIAFYNSYTKEPSSLITNLEFFVSDGEGNDQEQTVYVEARAPSDSLRDIRIYASVDGERLDSVSATAIWVERQNVYHTRVASPIPDSLGIDKVTMLHFIHNYGFATDSTWYGYGSYRPIPGITPTQDGMFGGRILFEFELKPDGIEDELDSLGIKYDLSRRKQLDDAWIPYGISTLNVDTTRFPILIDEANDDSECHCASGPSDRLDEDESPIHNEIFSYDAPSVKALGSANAFKVRRLEFEEFVRVSFGPDIEGNIIGGSRCSDHNDWELQFALKSGSTLNNTDPYEKIYHLLIPAPPGLNASQAKRLAGNPANGVISIDPISSSNIYTYFLLFNESETYWDLVEKTSSGNNVIASSNISSSDGPWLINHANVTVNIENGSIPFAAFSTYSFSIWDVPTTTNSLISN